MSGNNNTDTAIKLLIIEQSLNDAESEISALRNAGLAVHATKAIDQESLYEALEETKYDIILCLANHPSLELSSTLAVCKKACENAVFIVIYREREYETLMQAMREGARDIVSADEQEHLSLVVRREFNDLIGFWNFVFITVCNNRLTETIGISPFVNIFWIEISRAVMKIKQIIALSDKTL